MVGTSNHIHQLSNFIAIDGDVPIHLTPDKIVPISGILDVGTNGNSAWNEVNAKLVTKFQPTQIPGTATFLKRRGDITVLGGRSATPDRNSGLLKARLKCSADSQTT
jgi:hypothetical protein